MSAHGTPPEELLEGIKVVAGNGSAAEIAAAVAVVRAALEAETKEHERVRLATTDDWNVSQRGIRAAGPFGGVSRRTLR